MAGLVFFTAGRASIKKFATAYPIVNKSWIYYPLVGSTLAIGSYLYDKLKGHYFNWFDFDILHHWHIDYQSKYKLKDEDVNQDWQKNLQLTEFDRLTQAWENSLNQTDIDGAKTLRRISKDKNDFFYLFSKIRNLENIVFLSEEDLKGINSPVELQIKIDSVTPDLLRSGDLNEDIKKFQQVLKEYKYMVENSDNFRSIKDKMLGLPFMMYRMRQFPEPNPGTWQYRMFERFFGFEYDYLKDEYESEEKINKFNYAKHLHPSIIKKFDVESEEFEMYIKKLNYETKTQKEAAKFYREIYCKYILPKINNLKDENFAADVVHYIINKKTSNDYENYLFDHYSNEKEEFLFREVEEANFLNKNKPLVNRFMYSNIDKSKIGIRASQLDEILKNPTKYKTMRKALEAKFDHYEPVSYLDKLKFAARKAGYLDTMIENEVDVRDPEFNILDLFVQQYGYRQPTEEEEVAKAHHVNYPQYGFNNNTYPYAQDDFVNYFSYNGGIDWKDYCSEFPGTGFVSPKKDRLELSNKYLQSLYDKFFLRFYNNPKFDNFTGYIYPYKDYDNEELAERIPKRTNFLKYVERQKLTDSEMDTLRFLEDTTEKESFAPSDDLTEEELDQAIFESTYMKPIHETDEYKSKFIKFKFNFSEINLSDLYYF